MRADLALIFFLLSLGGGIVLLALRKKRGGVPLLTGGIVLLICAAALALYLAAAVLLVLAVPLVVYPTVFGQDGILGDTAWMFLYDYLLAAYLRRWPDNRLSRLLNRPAERRLLP